MGFTIQTNVASLNAQRNLATNQSDLSSSLSRLSSGYRITRAGDDAAGLAISENLRAQVRGLQQASRNANDGISLVQTAEGGLNEISNILIRLRELSIQASSDNVGSTERDYIHKEFSQLRSEIDRIANTTEFNGTKLLDGTASSTALDFQVGIRNTTNDRISITVAGATAAKIGGSSTKLSASVVSTKVQAQSTIGVIDSAIQNISSVRARLGALQNRLQSTVNNLGVQTENLSAANSRIRDVDVASETARLTRSQILVQASTAILAQANAAPQQVLSLLR